MKDQPTHVPFFYQILIAFLVLNGVTEVFGIQMFFIVAQTWEIEIPEEFYVYIATAFIAIALTILLIFGIIKMKHFTPIVSLLFFLDKLAYILYVQVWVPLQMGPAFVSTRILSTKIIMLSLVGIPLLIKFFHDRKLFKN